MDLHRTRHQGRGLAAHCCTPPWPQHEPIQNTIPQRCIFNVLQTNPFYHVYLQFWHIVIRNNADIHFERKQPCVHTEINASSYKHKRIIWTYIHKQSTTAMMTAMTTTAMPSMLPRSLGTLRARRAYPGKSVCVYLRLKNIMKVSNTATQAKHRYWQQNTNIFHDWLSQLHLRYRSYILSYLCIDESWTGPKACMLCAFACRLLWWRSREHLAIMLCVNMALSYFDQCHLRQKIPSVWTGVASRGKGMRTMEWAWTKLLQTGVRSWMTILIEKDGCERFALHHSLSLSLSLQDCSTIAYEYQSWIYISLSVSHCIPGLLFPSFPPPSIPACPSMCACSCTLVRAGI